MSNDSVIAQEPVQLKRWTVGQYHQMTDWGLLDQAERTELIAGQIVLKAAKGTAHVVALSLLANLLQDRLGRAALIRMQDPIQLDLYSEPEPDLAVVQGRILDYLTHHPQPQEIYWLVEVADSTLRNDCRVKDKLYAKAGILEYWVLDVVQRQLHVLRDLKGGCYQKHLTLTEFDQITPEAFADLSLPITEMLPPIS